MIIVNQKLASTSTLFLLVNVLEILNWDNFGPINRKHQKPYCTLRLPIQSFGSRAISSEMVANVFLTSYLNMHWSALLPIVPKTSGLFVLWQTNTLQVGRRMALDLAGDEKYFLALKVIRSHTLQSNQQCTVTSHKPERLRGWQDTVPITPGHTYLLHYIVPFYMVASLFRSNSIIQESFVRETKTFLFCSISRHYSLGLNIITCLESFLYF